MTRFGDADPDSFPDPGIREQIRAAQKESERLEKGSPATSRRQTRRLEQQTQIACVELAQSWTLPIRGSWPNWMFREKVARFLFHVPNGGARSEVEGAIFKAMGVKAGVHDLFFMLPALLPAGDTTYRFCPGMWLEAKAGDNELTESQKDFEALAKALGYVTSTFRTVDEFKAAIELYIYGAVSAQQIYEET